MATLSALDQQHRLTLTPRSVEAGSRDPRWLRYELSIPGADHLAIQQISLTDADVTGLVALFGSAQGSRRFHGTDETLIIELQEAEGPMTFFISVWVGEPYVAMQGWRFPVSGADVMAFGQALQQEAVVVLRA